MPYDLRDGDEKLNDEQAGIHDAEHDPANPDPRCWRCKERAAKLCRCGHDEDEHREIKDAYDTGETYLLCDVEGCECKSIKGERKALCACGHDLQDEHRVHFYPLWVSEWLICDVCLGDCVTKVGEREAYEGKVKL